MPPGGGYIIKALHHPAARKQALHVQFVDSAHQLEIIFADRSRLEIQAALVYPEQIGLTCEAVIVVAVGHFFARPKRPALASASPKKSFSSVSWSIFA